MHFDSPTVTMVRCEAEVEEPLLGKRGSAERNCENSGERSPWLGLFCTMMTESREPGNSQEARPCFSQFWQLRSLKPRGWHLAKVILPCCHMVGSRKARVEKRQEGKLGIVTHACDPSTLEAEVEGASGYRASSRSADTKIKACIKKRERDWNFLEGTGSKGVLFSRTLNRLGCALPK